MEEYVSISSSCFRIKKSKKEITKFFSEKYQVNNLIIKRIDSEFIQHKLSHINIKSRFWLTENKINVHNGIYVSSFKEYQCLN